MPLAGPNAVANSKMASMHSLPARLTRRGGVRRGGMRKFAGFVRASVWRSVASIAGRPAMVWMFQVKASTSRQSPSARNKPAAAAASARLQGRFEGREPAFGVGLRRMTWAILDYCHRETRELRLSVASSGGILLQRCRAHHVSAGGRPRCKKNAGAKPAYFCTVHGILR